ncbi:MAG: hypothetical protein H0W74_13445 [Sphingosinicella sp.]|nr:hypothetical protein [Sphingosinicella sp.]
MYDPEQVIINGDAVARFLNDSAIQAAIRDTKLLYFNDWYAAETLEERERLWAKARALDDLQINLQAIVDAGELAKRE